jgi:hypothetical protein
MVEYSIHVPRTIARMVDATYRRWASHECNSRRFYRHSRPTLSMAAREYLERVVRQLAP